MENDRQNLITRIITYLVIFLGVLFTLIVMSDDNPKEMNPEQIKVAAFNNDQFEFEKDEKGRFIKDKFGNYTYKDLDNDSTYSKSEGEILRNYQTSLEQTLDSHVFTLTFFSIVTVTATFLLLILGFGYLAYINWAKAKKNYNRAIQIKKNYIPSINNLGNLLIEDGLNDKALKYFKIADPTMPL